MKNKIMLLISIVLFACISLPRAGGDTTNVPAQEEVILPTQTQSAATPTEEVPMPFVISSPAFANGAAIPDKYSCKGSDATPALTWSEPPAGTQSFALIMDDPDAPSGTWVHWVIFNIPASARGLDEGLPTDAQLSDRSLQGRSSAGTSGYHGPCPPSGTHHYFFKLYALDAMLELPTNTNKKDLLAAMEGHILANVELMGTFSR
jgi:Raf kinase inhibitor-like YbhB/YbcL family protein